MNKSRKVILCILILSFVTGISYFIHSYLFKEREKKYDDLIQTVALRHNVPPTLVKAVIRRESKFKAGVRGGHGEYGLMQITNRAADDWIRERRKKKFSNYDQLFSPELNIEIGTWYLAKGLKKYQSYKHKYALTLAHYNAGPRNVIRNKWVPSHKDGEVLNLITFPSTKKYIRDILKYEQEYVKKGFEK